MYQVSNCASNAIFGFGFLFFVSTVISLADYQLFQDPTITNTTATTIPLINSMIRLLLHRPTIFHSHTFQFLSTTTETFQNKKQHIQFLQDQATLPSGFSAGISTFKFSPQELPTLDASMTLTMLSLDDPNGTAAWSAMYTKNAFPGSPVTVGKDLLADPISRIQGIICNNKISNVFPGGKTSGVDNAKKVAQSALNELNQANNITNSTSTSTFLPSSTGVIGWRIPVDEMIQEMPTLIQNLDNKSALPAAQGIMTTDLYPKVRGVEIPCENGDLGLLTGIAKGAGMIEPNMATMLGKTLKRYKTRIKTTAYIIVYV